LRLLWGELILFGLVTLSLGLLLGWVLAILLGRVGSRPNPAMAMAFGQERLYFSTDVEPGFGFLRFFLSPSSWPPSGPSSDLPDEPGPGPERAIAGWSTDSRKVRQQPSAIKRRLG